MKKTNLLVLCLVSGIVIGSAQNFSEQSLAIGFDHSVNARALMGGGAAFFDYDNDGDEDMYVTGGYRKDDLYENNGDGTFTRIFADIGIGITVQYNTTGVTTGDIDNDGDRDIFVATWDRSAGSELPTGRSLLFLNNGDGTFTEIGQFAGITEEVFTIGGIFLDYNKDGFLDIYAMNHILQPNFITDEDGLQAFDHDCYANFLYLNNGNNTFTEVGEALGVNDEGCALAAIATDYDMDGDLDLYIANDFGEYIIPNMLFENNYPIDNFSNVSSERGADLPIFGMGIACGDYDHDQDFDYYVTNLGRNVLCENTDGNFVDVTTIAGVENATVPEENDLNTTGWGTAFFDIDNDTWEDLYVANGRIPSLPQHATATFDPDKLYLNNGDKTFTDVSDEAGVSDTDYVHGMAYADYDEDGDLDIVTVALSELGGRSKFYINETEHDNNYIQLKLIGVESNRDAFGSKAFVYTDDLVQIKEIDGGGASHASQHTSILHFGLGQYEQVDSVRIEWTNGITQVVDNPAINMRHTVVEDVTTSLFEPVQGTLDVVVAPNPFINQVTLYAGDRFVQEELAVKLTTMDGSTVLETTLVLDGQSNLGIDESLPAGMYILQLRSSTEWMAQKLIKK
ncbi:MAG: FG-GAP-like repeat-containing protein [Bacteroidota bacterium]